MFFIYLMAIEDEAERASIAALYARHRYHCLHMARKLDYNAHDAEDIVQEVFVRIINHKDDYLKLNDEEFKALLVTIIKNIVKDDLKKKAGNPHVSDGFEERAKIKGMSPERLYIIHERFNAIMEELQNYDEVSRFIMYYKSLELPDKTIAAILDIPCRTVQTKVYRIRKELREKYKGVYYDD